MQSPIILDESFEILLSDLVPKEWFSETSNPDLITFSYKTLGRGNSPKSFTFPKKINVDKNLMEGIGLYIGDGKLSKDLNHIEFTSIDPDLLKFMEDFFRNRFNNISLEGIKENVLSLRVNRSTVIEDASLVEDILRLS